MTKDKGRGVFAKEVIKENELLIVEKPIVHILIEYCENQIAYKMNIDQGDTDEIDIEFEKYRWKFI